MNLKSDRSLQAYLSTRDAAAYLGVSRRWLEVLRQIGGGPEYRRLARRKVVYAIRDLEAWADRFRRRNTSESGDTSVEVG
jgi:hypothetical protein